MTRHLAEPAHRRGECCGSVLITVLFLVALVHLVLLAVTTRAILSAQAVTRQERRLQAFNAAEAGLARAFAVLARGDDPDGLDGGTSVARWTVTARRTPAPDGWDTWQLLSAGACHGTTERLDLEVRAHAIEASPPRLVLAGFHQLAPTETP